MVICYISKAFDRVWHRGLLHKLAGISCSDSFLDWCLGYLSDRQQRVVLNGHLDGTSVKAGVPQESILGPLLFLISINDIVQNINSSSRLFADDTTLYMVVDSPKYAATALL